MKVGIMQPYLLPYIGYFQLMKAVDEYVIADNLNYIKQGWINRNRLLLNGKEFLFSLAVIGASQNKLINEVVVADDQAKLLKTIEVNYRKAPCFAEVFPLIEKMIGCEDKNLARYLGNSLMIVADYLKFGTKFSYMSDLDRDLSLKSQDMVINVCTIIKATEYINAIGGTALYDKDIFKQAGVDLFFLKTKEIEYKQFNNSFVPGLSMLDVLMFNSVEQTNELLEQYELI